MFLDTDLPGKLLHLFFSSLPNAMLATVYEAWDDLALLMYSLALGHSLQKTLACIHMVLSLPSFLLCKKHITYSSHISTSKLNISLLTSEKPLCTCSDSTDLYYDLETLPRKNLRITTFTPWLSTLSGITSCCPMPKKTLSTVTDVYRRMAGQNGPK